MRTRIAASILAAAVAAAAPGAQQPPLQAPDPSVPVSFEVASVKPNKSADRGGTIRRQSGGRITAANMPLRILVTFAYQLQQFQLIGAPGWMADERFDIVGKLDGDPPPVMPGSGPDPIMLAMRTLLAERFKLKVHREAREMDIYALVMARPAGRPGPSLKPSTQDCSAQARRGAPPPAGFCGIQGTPGRIRFGGFPLSQLASALGGQAGRMVVDRTGLSGNWEFELAFQPEQQGPPPPGVDLPAIDPNAPSLFTALQEQLGLKLEPAKGPVDVLVVDNVQPLTEE